MIINPTELRTLYSELDTYCQGWDSDMLLKALIFLELNKLNRLLGKVNSPPEITL